MNIDILLKQHPSFTYADELAQLTSPLKKLGIDYFAHMRLDDDGNIFSNNNHPTYFESYHRHNCYRQGIYKKDNAMALINTQGFFLWDKSELSKSSQTIYQLSQAHNIGHLCTLIRQRDTATDVYHFGTQLGNERINHFYVHNLDLMHKFIDYFSEQLHLNDYLIKAKDFTVHVGNQAEVKELPLILSREKREDYFRSIGLQPSTPCNLVLTRREYQCGYYLLQGFTSKQIADVLHISPRTVEVYIERLRTRFGSKNKVHLARHLMESKSIATES